MDRECDACGAPITDPRDPSKFCKECHDYKDKIEKRGGVDISAIIRRKSPDASISTLGRIA